MLIIGINSLGHDTSAAVVKDGRLLFAIEEERIIRQKHTTKFPANAIKECLRFVGAEIEDVDIIAVGLIPERYVKHKILEHTLKYFPKANSLMADEAAKAGRFLAHEKHIREQLGFKKKIIFMRHHLCHMASSFYLSNFSESAIFSIDGIGEIESSLTGIGKGVEITTFEEDKIDYPVSIGLLYAGITWFLGFRHHCDEGKVMGLAPYGDAKVYRKLFEDIIKMKPNGKYDFDLSYITFPFERDTWVSPKFIKEAGNPRKMDEPLEKRHKDIAAALQEATEKAMVHTADYLFTKTKTDNLCLAGGVALNCVANGIVLKKSKFTNIYVQPGANDAGVAIGAALLAHYQNTKEAKRYEYPKTTYLGTGYDDSEVLKDLDGYDLEIKKVEDAAIFTADALADNKIISWFNGRMEFGPRALGNRSILASPISNANKDAVNKVKQRELWRPLCPSMLHEARQQYLEDGIESPFMILMDYVTKEKAKEVEAIVHVDNSTRPQTVTKDGNKDFWALLSAFKKKTGIPVLLNTSQNRNFEPMVMTPKQAIECFIGTDIDYLVFNNRIIVGKNKKPAAAGESDENAVSFDKQAKKFMKAKNLPSSPDTQMIRMLHRKGVLPPKDDKQKMLDVGCWDGGTLAYFARYGFNVSGTDVAEPEMELTRRNFKNAGLDVDALEILKDNKLNFPDNAFDFVLCWKTIYWAGSKENIAKILKEIHRVLKPGMPAMISIPDNDSAHVVNSIGIGGSLYRQRRYDGSYMTFYHFRTEKEFAGLMSGCGFGDIEVGSTGGYGLHKLGDDPSALKRNFRVFYGLKK